MKKKKDIDNNFLGKSQKLWKSYDQLLKKETFTRNYLHREFPENASELSDKLFPENSARNADVSQSQNAGKDKLQLNRRDFFKAMGASLALAGLGGCGSLRKPKSKLYPYAKRPEFILPGEALYFATAFHQGDDVAGLLVETYSGRPTKLEGNPLHPESLGKTNHFQQASILDLYDPDRLKAVMENQKEVGREQLNAWVERLLKKGENSLSKGKGLGIVFSHQPSLSFYGLLDELKKQLPEANVYRFDSVSNDNVIEGVRNVSGKAALPVLNYGKADVIVSLGSDFLSMDCGSLRSARHFANRRNPEGAKFNRLYVYENNFTITGGAADHRFRLKRRDIELLLYAIINECYHQGMRRINRNIIALAERYQQDIVQVFRGSSLQNTLEVVVSDLLKNAGRSILVAGADLPPIVHSLVFYLNELLKAPVSYYAPPVGLSFLQKENSLEAAERLSKDLSSGKIDNIVSLDVDLVGQGPADFNFKELLSKTNLLSLSTHQNATTQVSDIVVPQSHYLEQWGDLVSLRGHLSVVQPAIRPMSSDSFSSIGFLKFLLEKLTPSGKNKEGFLQHSRQEWERMCVKERLSSYKKGTLYWQGILRNGVIKDFVSNELKLKAVRLDALVDFYRERKVEEEGSLEAVFELDYSVYDGRYVNNAWLQELPDPITKLTWDNAVIISKKTADRLGVKNQDVVEIALSRELSNKIKGPVWILPGQADDSISLKMGYGQKWGKIADGAGFDVSSLRNSKEYFFVSGVKLKKTSETYPLASVQDHWSIDDEIFEGGPSSNSQNGRSLYKKGTYVEYVSGDKNFMKGGVETPTLPKYHDKWKNAKKANKELKGSDEMSVFKEQEFTGEYQWGMVIDLARCTGCNACVVACQAENNIPVVGKEMVLMGREMHWIRLDRYFDGDPHDPDMVHQPVACAHCEQAPCEQVCPVAATVHSQEGLNDMIYNRCIGTRFCSNNCPYKVRRFNFFDYHARSPHAKRRLSSHFFDLFKEPVESLQMQFNPDVSVRMRGVMEKCTYCVQRINKVRVFARNGIRRIEDGEIEVACEQACPSRAIVFGDVSQKTSQVSQKKSLKRDYSLLGELNIQPRTTYLAALTNPNEKIKK